MLIKCSDTLIKEIGKFTLGGPRNVDIFSEEPVEAVTSRKKLFLLVSKDVNCKCNGEM